MVAVTNAFLVVREDELVDALHKEFASSRRIDPATPKISASRPQVFAAMPFASEFDDVYFVAISGAADAVGLTAYRVDYDDRSGDVVEKIKAEIRRSVLMVADLSRQRPNVLYEMGYAQAIRDLGDTRHPDLL